MSSLQLDSSSNIIPEPQKLPQALVEKCAAISVRPNAIKDLIDAMQCKRTFFNVFVTCNLSHSTKHRKMADFDPSRRAKTPKPISMKLGMVDYVQDPTQYDNFDRGSATWVVWANL